MPACGSEQKSNRPGTWPRLQMNSAVSSDEAEAGTANRSVCLKSEASTLSAQAGLLRAEYDRGGASAGLARLTGTP